MRLPLAVLHLSTFFVISAIPNSVQAQVKRSTKPATKEQIMTYSTMSLQTFCFARNLDIDFKKSVSVAIAAELNFIALVHDFKIEGIAKPFTKKLLQVVVPNRLIMSAIKFCPEYVPEKVKKEVDELKKKFNKS